MKPVQMHMLKKAAIHPLRAFAAGFAISTSVGNIYPTKNYSRSPAIKPITLTER
jgi:hypothetical protein